MTVKIDGTTISGSLLASTVPPCFLLLASYYLHEKLRSSKIVLVHYCTLVEVDSLLASRVQFVLLVST